MNDIASITRTGRDLRIYSLLAGWFLINFFSSWFTELSYDEAYYWMYSRFPDWGYFDHPPMVGWLVKAGTVLLPGEAGVRFFILLCSCGTIWLLYKMMDRPSVGILALIVFSVFPFQMFGFMSVPDGPLLLFGALFFFSYKTFLKENSAGSVLLLAISMAGLLYCKYHGIVFIGATLISNPALIKNKKALAAVLLSVVLYIPHILWQYKHDYITFWFHLVGRSPGPYHFEFTAEYLLSQLLFYGPFTGILLVYGSWKYRSANLFEKALRYTFVGTFLFFLLSTFKGRVEANWTIPALIPMTYLAMRYMEEKPVLLKWLRISAAVSVPLFVVVRLVLAFPGDVYFHRMGEIAGGREYVRQVMSKAGDLPLIANSYQEAARLSFYSGRLVPSLNINGRHNQYDLWNFSRTYEGKPVILLTDFQKQGIPLLNSKKDTCYLTSLAKLPLYQGLMISTKGQSVFRNSTVKLPLRIRSLCGDFPASMSSPVAIRYFFRDKKTAVIVKEGQVFITPVPSPDGNWQADVSIETPEKSADYKLTFSFYNEGLGDWGTWKSAGIEVK